MLARHQEAGRVVKTFADKPFAKDFIALCIGDALELGPHRVVRQFLRLGGAKRIGMVLEHHQIAEPWSRRWPECRLPIGRPEIGRVAQRLLDAIVEVVAERADMGLDLDHGQQVVSDLDDEVPILRGPEIARQCLSGDEDVRVGNAGVAQHIGKQADESVAVLATRYRRAAAGILLAGCAALTVLLAAADLPEMADSFGEPFLEVEH